MPRNAWAPLQLVLRTAVDEGSSNPGPNFYRVYLAEASILEGETFFEFLDRGGIFYMAEPTIGMDAAKVIRILKNEQNVEVLPPTVRVADYDAVLIHSDPILRDDLRPYALYWSDGRYDYTLEADADRADLVALARTLYCQ